MITIIIPLSECVQLISTTRADKHTGGVVIRVTGCLCSPNNNNNNPFLKTGRGGVSIYLVVRSICRGRDRCRQVQRIMSHFNFPARKTKQLSSRSLLFRELQPRRVIMMMAQPYIHITPQRGQRRRM